jgi:hypothetical protein
MTRADEWRLSPGTREDAIPHKVSDSAQRRRCKLVNLRSGVSGQDLPFLPDSSSVPIQRTNMKKAKLLSIFVSLLAIGTVVGFEVFCEGTDCF